MRERGFTLPELIIVIVIGGVLAATLTVFFRPAIDSWLALRVRGDLTDQASAALQAMRRDVRVAVPNSIRTPSDQCFELVPTAAGGRFRKDADPGGGSYPLDLSTGTTQFDVLSPLAATPSAGDYVVVDNQNPGDVYAGTNRSTVSAVGAGQAGVRLSSITMSAPINDPGYQGGRFVIVPTSQQAVTYLCSGAGVDGSGNGTGTLMRYAHYGFVSSYPASCSPPAGGSSALLATRVKSCSFVYSPNKGATQQSGFVSMQLELSRNAEVVSLLVGAHVMNVP